jgi:putative SOS response-associated peptidase YedK
MTRAKDDLHLVVPQRFFVHGQHAQGDRHLYASRTRFIPEKLLELFERKAWPLVPAGTAENRCVVPFNSFSEFNKAEGGDIWFALDETRPLACFAGIWTNWTSVRKVKEGETTNDIFAFLTTEPNAEVGTIHPKAMPVILTTSEEFETWMTAPPDEVLKLQRPRQGHRGQNEPLLTDRILK